MELMAIDIYRLWSIFFVHQYVRVDANASSVMAYIIIVQKFSLGIKSIFNIIFITKI